MPRFLEPVAACCVVGATIVAGGAASAIGVHYADPGWAYAFDGDQAYYHDPDGPNPDYINGSDQNQPGGRGGEPALVDPAADGVKWFGSGQWDGSAPGDPLGGIPTGIPPIPPAAPGGVGAFADADATTFLRIQDAGNPQDYGWADKGSQAAPGAPRQEGNNRRMIFGHDIAIDATFNGDPAVIDNGFTVSFRARLATRETGPLDDLYIEGGTTAAHVQPWPEDGLGYDVHTEGRGMFMIAQSGTGGPGQMGFSLLDDDTVTIEGLDVNVGTKRGLVLNGRSNPTCSPSTNSITPATLNIVEIPDGELDQWQEFWITVQKLPVPVNGNTHEAKVYYNGSLDALTFPLILDLENEFGGSAYLGMGLSSDSRQGAFDVDFIAYKQGVIVPTLAAVENADFDEDGDVDGTDLLSWQRGVGTNSGATRQQGDADGNGAVNGADLAIWRAQFASPATAAFRATPEPTSANLLTMAMLAAASCRRSSRWSLDPHVSSTLR